MDQRRPVSTVYSRQWSGSSTGWSSPAHPQSRFVAGATGFSTVKRTQNAAAKVAAQRLAKVMVLQTSTDEDDDEENGFNLPFRLHLLPPFSIANNNSHNYRSRNSILAILVSRPNRSPSPALHGEMCKTLQFIAKYYQFSHPWKQHGLGANLEFRFYDHCM